MRRMVLWAACLAALAAGCGKAPTLAGGKPVAYWVEALRGPDAKARKEAVQKLGNVGAADPAVLAALEGALRDRDPAVRCEAVLALLKCGDAAREAVPALEEAARTDRSAQVRAYAGRALEKLRAGGEGG